MHGFCANRTEAAAIGIRTARKAQRAALLFERAFAAPSHYVVVEDIPAKIRAVCREIGQQQQSVCERGLHDERNSNSTGARGIAQFACRYTTLQSPLLESLRPPGSNSETGRLLSSGIPRLPMTREDLITSAFGRFMKVGGLVSRVGVSMRHEGRANAESP